MRVVGLGVDLADISRVERLLVRYPRFAQRCFTLHEQEYAERFARPARRYAARFAGKEAVMKSLGTGYRHLRWTEIEITGGGKPTVNLSGTAAAWAGSLGVTHIEVAITHTDTDALVFALALGEHLDDPDDSPRIR
ncbi:MAG: holo-ACP synthase [bacterium]|nr:holo-ACP synthase [bacterium]